MNHPARSRVEERRSRWPSRPTLLVLLAMLVATSLLRVLLSDGVEMVAERQYRSAVLARHFFMADRNDIPEWRQEVLAAQVGNIGSLEPPITEWVVSRMYRLAGAEDLRWARLVTVSLWAVGGIFVFGAAYLLTCPAAALVAATYYMVVPQALITSSSFLPEPLMIMLMSAALFLILRYSERSSSRRLLAASATCAAAILSKVLCALVLSAAFLAVLFGGSGDRRKSLGHGIVFLGIAGLPSMVYYGAIAAEQGPWATASRVIPSLLLTREYWISTLGTAVSAVGAVPIAVGLLGIAVADAPRTRRLLLGLWVGYGMFCLAFSNHVRFAGYYHVQLIVVVALSAAPLVAAVIHRTASSPRRRLQVAVVAVAVAVGASVLSIKEVRSRIASRSPHVSPAVAGEIGELVGHSTRTVLVARYYGAPLSYLGELSGMHWYEASPGPIAGDDPWSGRLDWRNIPPGGFSLATRLDAIGYQPEYFVITDLERFGRVHADLGRYLAENCSERARTELYVIYHRCEDPRTPA